MKAEVLEILTGTTQAYGPNGEPSAFCKTPAGRAVSVSETGLAGDEQADLANHGGVDKAVLHYDVDHYEQWRLEHPELANSLVAAGAFGENISTAGISESSVCLGDRFALGTALVEVSQGRQPCWKLGHRFGNPRMVGEVLKKARGGWYYRVIEPGVVGKGDEVVLKERPCPDWPVTRLFATLFAGEGSRDDLDYLASNALLARSWRDRAYKLR